MKWRDLRFRRCFLRNHMATKIVATYRSGEEREQRHWFTKGYFAAHDYRRDHRTMQMEAASAPAPMPE